MSDRGLNAALILFAIAVLGGGIYALYVHLGVLVLIVVGFIATSALFEGIGIAILERWVGKPKAEPGR